MQVLAEKLRNTACQLNELGLNKGTSGNASVRVADGFLITPSGMPVEQMSADSMVYLEASGKVAAQDLHKKPSSEWRFHRDILAARSEINAVVHTHSMFATTLACLQLTVPAFHYMIAIAGGDSIPCAPYALFGSALLSEVALVALQDRKACLLANHGMIALGRNLDDALAVAVEVENLCEQYWRILQIAPPKLLDHHQMQAVFEQFKGYGQWGK